MAFEKICFSLELNVMYLTHCFVFMQAANQNSCVICFSSEWKLHSCPWYFFDGRIANFYCLTIYYWAKIWKTSKFLMAWLICYFFMKKNEAGVVYFFMEEKSSMFLKTKQPLKANYVYQVHHYNVMIHLVCTNMVGRLYFDWNLNMFEIQSFDGLEDPFAFLL